MHIDKTLRATANSNSMAAGTLLHLSCTGNKCLFATARYCKPQLQVSQYRQIRNLRRLKLPFLKSEIPVSNVKIGIGPSKLWMHLGFATAFSGASIVGAAIWEYEHIRQGTYKILNHYNNQFRINRTGWRGKVEKWWKTLSDGEKVFVPILFLNTVVFLAWRVPALQKTMVRYFSANPGSSVSCWPMIFSAFSHHNIFHLAVNMYVLHNFSTLAGQFLGKEQFVALYLSSGVISSFAAYLYKTIYKIPFMSLGASGAIMGILGCLLSEYPDVKLRIVFLPMFEFTAGAGLTALMLIDLTGCLLRWKYFDHAAHLGGALFGIFWQVWGIKNIWQKRDSILAWWREFREPPGSE
ncbi:PREDICTED: presenilins-associated rhomboid-like protein, mitochondrial isoform X2 [Dinoponera quadriceps]|uniref:rhomboid protease n=1 Tax=Dinoponera quadriceps TaxID=609295 RepID=A0A6P3XRV6_DINQU|nr:PREDICTED: presenilins-associated rhomboid-like protein, mitochondrial isoform X2 [Dinoponera quadriceps]